MIKVQAMNNIDAEGADEEEDTPAALLKDAEDSFAWVFGAPEDDEQVVDADEQVVDADEQEGDEVNGILR